jgi:RNA-directed DNA polymerase
VLSSQQRYSTEKLRRKYLKKTKPFHLPKQLFVQAYKLVKANAGTAGVDQQSIEAFSRNAKDNLYKLWNRMSSGCYFPPPVKAVSIPKKTGGERVLGIPTVEDRIAQMVVKLILEPEIEPHFLADSYGYRPNKSALAAVGITRKRCWQYDWVVEFDIKGLFDNISHELLMKALYKHTKCQWVILCIKRWLTAPMQLADGTIINRETGTPQGGVISPLLSNLFLHYAFDKWMQQHYPDIPWCRYADDGLLHCKTQMQARYVLDMLAERFKSCKLQLHPDKTKIVYCKDSNRGGECQSVSFDFLGFTFRPREAVNRQNKWRFTSFTPAASKASMKAMRAKVKRCRIGRRTELELRDIAKMCNPMLRGWINYYGTYHGSGLEAVYRHFNKTLVTWAMRKYKKLRHRKMKAIEFLGAIAKENPTLFAHWHRGRPGAFT